MAPPRLRSSTRRSPLDASTRLAALGGLLALLAAGAGCALGARSGADPAAPTPAAPALPFAGAGNVLAPAPLPAGGDASPIEAAPPAAFAVLPPGTLDNLPPPLPPPEPPPNVIPLPAGSTEADVLDLLWGHRLEFGPGAQPLVTIRLMDGQSHVALRTMGPGRLSLRGGRTIDLQAGTRLVASLRSATPARIEYAPLLAEAAWADRSAIEAARADWSARGVAVRVRVIGGVYGIAGRVVDTRRQKLLADGDRSEAGAQALAEALQRLAGQRVSLDAEPVSRPRATLVLSSEAGPIGEADGAATVEPLPESMVVVEAVEHGLDGHAAREERRYRSRLVVAADAAGMLTLVAALPLEELLRGLVPAEMPAGSSLEALKAQAVTARSNVLAQLGTRHLADPYVICAEVHCQAYRGVGAETARTDEAVRATRGEALFGRVDRTLVDGVYSAMCGGHGEDNDAVWPTTPSPSLRGGPDLAGPSNGWARGLREEPVLRRFLATPVDAWCRRPAAASKSRYRWERRFTPADLDAVTSPLQVGHVKAVQVLARGVSGRAISLRITGTEAAVDVAGELKIRRLLRNLPSAMFVIDQDGDDLLLRGGGWGHGAGMCQWGAVGRAEAGQGYREILRAYFSGAEVARIY